MSAVSLTALDGVTVFSVEATTVTGTVALDAGFCLLYGVAAATRVDCGGTLYDVLGSKASVDAIIAAGIPARVQWLKFSAQLACSLFVGPNSIKDGGAKQYNVAGGNGETGAADYPVPAACTVSELRAKASANTATTALVLTLYKNGVATALTVTIGIGSTALVSDTTHSVTFAAGDLLDLRGVGTAGAGSIIFGATMVATLT